MCQHLEVEINGIVFDTCVDPDGLLHVEGDSPQELSEEKQNNQIHPRLRIL